MAIFYNLYGGLGSPYSLKIRALLRYRRVPHLWVTDGPRVLNALEQVKVPVIPVLEYPDGHFANDSTPLIFDLEKRFSERSVIPDDPALAFLACLIEDMADEWGTKIMFEYRWRQPLDQETVSKWLSYDRNSGQGIEKITDYADAFRARQVSRMPMVGCTPENLPVIEHSFNALLSALETIFTDSPFLFGTRPSLADFSLYGQLSQLGDDPTPREKMRVQAPYTLRWVTGVDDASGNEGAWSEDVETTLARLAPLLALCGQVYLPFLEANMRAVATEAEAFGLDLPGGRYSQAPFKYQVKCLIALKDRYADLSDADKARISPALDAAGALAFIS